MSELREAIGFLEMLKGLNKTKVEIDLILPMLRKIESPEETATIGVNKKN